MIQQAASTGGSHF